MTVDIEYHNVNDVLVDKVLDCLQCSVHNRIVIAVAGVPGSGKSTVANAVCQQLNKRQDIESIVIGMDGFHLTREQLKAMKDPVYAFKRRGAPFTFDAEAFVKFVQKLSESCNIEESQRSIIKAPSFDHKLKDPTPDDVIIPVSANVIIVEGLYTLLNVDPWNKVHKMVDQSWLVKVDIDVARDRLAKRHFEAGIENSMEDAYARVDLNDTFNGEYILNNLVEGIDVVIN